MNHTKGILFLYFYLSVCYYFVGIATNCTEWVTTNQKIIINILSKEDVYNFQEHKIYTHLSVWLQKCLVIIGQHHPATLKFLHSADQVLKHVSRIRSLGADYHVDNQNNKHLDDTKYLIFLTEMKHQTYLIWNITATWGTSPAQSLPIQHTLLTLTLHDASSYLMRPACDLDLLRELYSQIKHVFDKFPTFSTFEVMSNSLISLLTHPQMEQKYKALVHFFCNFIAPQMYRDILARCYFLYSPQKVITWIKVVKEIQAMTPYSLGTHLNLALKTLEDFFLSVVPDRDKIRTMLQELSNAETRLTGNKPLWSNMDIQQIVRDIHKQHSRFQKQIRELYLMLPEMIFNPEQKQAVTKNLQLVIEILSQRSLFFQWKKIGTYRTLVLFVKALYLVHQLYHEKDCSRLKKQLPRLYDNFIPYHQLVESPVVAVFRSKSIQEEPAAEKILKILSSPEFGRDYLKIIFTKKYERLCSIEN